jgi:hypothetical protein
MLIHADPEHGKNTGTPSNFELPMCSVIAEYTDKGNLSDWLLEPDAADHFR